MAEANPLRGLPRIQRAAMSFPGHLHLVLVLRPKTHLQTTGTDLGFRFSQDDFALKMPMIMLSSLSDLLRFIDENQLSSEFGGNLEQCHSDWIVLRTAIESFAVTVKEIAQLLQTFGTELSETELPDEASGIEYLLRSHTDKYRQMKDDIRSVMRDGRQLLSNLEASKAMEGATAEDRDISQDKERVQKLVAQLRDMEMAFDGFFEKHHLKLQQYLQLLQYELSFHEMEAILEKLSTQEKAIASVGTTVAQTEQLLKDLEMLETTAEDEMGRAQIIILHGHQLAASHHYALALIVQRCNELRHHCDTLTTALRAKRASLTRIRDLLLRLEETVRWCDEGAYLMANQLLDKFQSKEGAQVALQDIEKLMEKASVLRSNPGFLSLEFEAILTPQLQSQIEAVTEKVSTVQGMIQNRQACLRKLAEIQARPIQLVAPRPENSPRCKSPLFSPKHSFDVNSSLRFSFDLALPGKRGSRKGPSTKKIEVMHDYEENRSCLSYGPDGVENPDQHKRHVMKELIETERIYVEELLSVLLGYRAEMDNPSLSNILPSVLRNKKEELFGNLPEIYKFHSRIFLQDLESCLESPERVGARFLERKENFQVYERYCQNKPRSDALWRQCSDSVFIQECKKKLDHKLGLDSYLLKPVQRLTKYQLLLKELLKHSSNSQYASELQGALNAMLDLLKSVNDSMHQISITGYEGELSDLGRVLMQGSFNIWINHRKGATRMKDMARFKPMQRHLFLHERALLFCKKREESGEGHDRTASYSFKHCLMMRAVGITENVKGDVKKFEIWYNGKEEVYVVQAPTVDVKIAWLTEIRKILNNQQKIDKGDAHPDSEQPLFTTLGDSVRHMSVCMPWTSTQITGCSGCFDVLPHSKLQGASVSSEEADSGRLSPVLTDPVLVSPRPSHHNRRSWPGTSQSVDICEGLEDWTTDISNISDSDEEDDVLLVPGRYRAMVDHLKCGKDDVIVKCGDVIHVLQESAMGLWHVKNLTRGGEGKLPVDTLLRMLEDAGRSPSIRSGSGLVISREI
ncbi:proto-oncogene DBL isoform X1 [Pimephales promelas]|uniref:proto-oncogene DBL isoform X1 n=1 Tax=Pimephales promelas TaxID=90988 RepID=UPI001955C713|nr:proto-oncogene DBL isoform X1 [Pimephales promelas]KAG1928429.1 proto-oncogene DBL [Pimephales promelas]